MEASTAVALCVLLGNLRILELPSGGSISLAAVPLLAYSATRGGRGAVLACWCAGAAHALSGGTIIHPVQLLLDYVVAYGVLAVPALTGAATVLRRTTGIVVALLLQLAVTTLSGVLFFSSVAGAAAWRYSLAYNATTTLPELALALITVPVAIRALQRADPSLAFAAAGAIVPARRSPRVAFIRTPSSPAVAPQLRQRALAAPPSTPTPAGVPSPPIEAAGRALSSRPAPFGRTMPWRGMTGSG
jgi:thiamine transporter